VKKRVTLPRELLEYKEKGKDGDPFLA